MSTILTASTPLPPAFIAARQYVASGLSLIPITPDGSKMPAWQLLPEEWCPVYRRNKPAWKPYQRRLPTAAELDHWFRQTAWGIQFGIAIVGGAVSGGLEIIDLDNVDLVEPWAAYVERHAPGLLDHLVYVETPRPGMHVYYRTAVASGSEKLACTLVHDEESGKLRQKTLIELKAEGGYVLAPGSPAICHPSGRPYVFVGDKDLNQVELISAADRTVLLDAAKALNDVPARPAVVARRRPSRRRASTGRPGDDFDARASWADILEPHGWTCVGLDAEGKENWLRPGKAQGLSATVNYAGADLLYVFSENADPFEAGEAYTKFSAFALLEHDGDFGQAAKALKSQGYGASGRLSHRRRRRGS